MRARELKVVLIWLTAAVFTAGAALVLLSPGFASALEHAGVNTAATPQALVRRRLLRAGYALDMLFLLAIGFLLRITARSRQVLNTRRKPWVTRSASLAAGLCLAMMVADAAENVAALLWLDGRQTGAWLQVASTAKWLLAGSVQCLLGALWWRPGARAARHRLAQFASLLLAAGGLSSCFLAASPLMGSEPLLAAVAMCAPALALLIQLGLWNAFAAGARLVYLLRVPAGCLLALAVFGPLALGPFRAFLGGLLDVNTWQLFLISVTAFITAFACVAQSALVLLHGCERTGDRTLHRFYSPPVLATVRRSASAAALLFSVCAGLSVDGWDAVAPRLVAVVSGYLAAVALVLAAEFIRARLSLRLTSPPPLVFAFARWPFVGARLTKAQQTAPPPLTATLATLLRSNLSGYGRGYWNSAGALQPGHPFAMALAAVSFAFYLAMILGKRMLPLGNSEAPLLPTLAAIALLLLSASWLLSGLAFLLDRYHVPLLSAIVLLWFGLAGSLQNSDHVFRLGDGGNGRYVLRTPSDVLAGYEDPVVIAAAGGGIQAAAWTTRVLQGLDGAWGDLSKQVAVLSAVSGGSVGALYFGAYLHTPPRQAFDQATRPSLDEVVWGFLGPDVFRPFLPAPWRHLDRGFALEDTLRARMGTRGNDTVRDWSNRAGARFPAFLFNTTVVETGQLMAFATTQFPSAQYRRDLAARRLRPFPAVESWARVYGLTDDDATVANFGLPVATAARLSAAFPYISPAARPFWEESPHAGDGAKARNFHLVDGGYYDNSGLVALTQWLDDALEYMPSRPARVRVVVIRGAVRPLTRAVPVWTWVHQAATPPAGYAGSREYGQWTGGSEQLRLLIDKWNAQGVLIDPVLIEYPDFTGTRPECAEPPLSWKLTATQKQCIDDAWLEGREPLRTSGSSTQRGPARR